MNIKKPLQHSLFLFTIVAQLNAATSTWTGTTNGDMNTGGNWSPAGVPPDSSDLVFPAGAITFTLSDTITGAKPIGSNSAGISSITINSPSASYSISAAAGNTFTLPNTFASIVNTGTNTFGIPLTLTGPLKITSSQAPLTMSGAIGGGAFSVEIAGGTVIFGVGNGYTGTTLIDAGATLQVATASALQSGVTDNGILKFAETGTETFSNVITSTTGGAVQMTGSGTLTLDATNTYVGLTTISSGTLAITNDNRLGLSANSVSLGGGTLALSTNNFTFTHPVSLTSAGTISLVSGATAATLSGVISEATAGVGLLTIDAGAGGTVTIFPGVVNTYTGGTVLKTGTLSISSQNNIGTGLLTLGVNTTLSITAPISNFGIPIALQGSSTINLNNNPVTISKPITGTGPLTVIAGTSTLTLTSSNGASLYTGGTSITSGTVLGDTSSIVGPYTINGTSSLTFDQTISNPSISSGTYSGVLTGAGPAQLAIKNAGIVIFTGNSGTTFTGSTSIASGGTLTVNTPGSLSGSTITMTTGGTLSGSGNVGPVTSTGAMIGPNGLNTLTINGTLSLDSASHYNVNISPNAISDLLQVTGAATLGNATVAVQPLSGFYGFGSTYTILQSGSLVGTFNPTPTSTNSNLVFTLSYVGNKVLLGLKVIQPFLGFPAENENVQSVIDNINALSASGALAGNTGLLAAINSLDGQSFAVINNALDQMHPAIFSAFSELQGELGSQIISLFHRRPGPTCCQKTWRVWAEPFGNWLIERSKGMQHGFDAQSRGVAAGFDWELMQNLILGFGGAANHSDLLWHNLRGKADANSYFGAAYADYTYKFLYVGGSLLAGIDHYATERRLLFTTIDENASGHHDAFDLAAQLSCGLFFGPSACCFWPYVNIDYFLLDHSAFKETGAPGLNLNIQGFSAQTIRTELGIGLQVQDTNYHETMCVSPRFSLGWTMQRPIKRDKITSAFQGETLSFNVEGWDQIWQLFSFTLGLNFSYKCFTLGGEYVGELDNNNHFWGQKANVNLVWNW